MIIKIYYFIFFLFWTIQFDTTSCRPANSRDYFEYLCEIVNYILFQDKNTSIQHLTDGLTENSDYTQDLGLEINNENFTRIFNAIIELLNYYVQVCNKLKVFYDEAFKVEYINFGFDFLLHPTTPRLVSPLYDDSSEYLAVNVINTLFNVDNRQSLINTKICVNNRVKDLNEIQHDEDNLTNFFQIKQEVAHLFKCRYSAFLKTIAVSFSAIQHLCQSEEDNVRYDNLVACVNSLKSTFSSVTTMITRLLAILALLKKASIGDYMAKSHSCFKKVVEIALEFNYILKPQNTSLIAETNTSNAMEFLVNIRKNQLRITHLFSDFKINQFLKNDCVIDKPLLNKFELIDSYQFGLYLYNNLSSDLIQICENFIKTDYDLCFSKLVKQYIMK
ncbi:uncharacterized protein LOC126899405 isoform X3 [Daktulosphaira vitifoliae]|uniref:uncharacterized protein LOC126899405 isoform X3 n=1 Tax=Daktulosphaira vitifoliae TaxID=58002 RepID=UPI0021A9EABE|nr:uncharacterized protein LOC126899405 isoform X3 [Daktulosphaira vitifoliae]